MRGLGRIFKRGSVYWIAYSYRGKEFRESSDSKSEAQAQRLLKKRIGEMGRGRLIGPVEERVTFDDMATALTHDYQVNGRKALSAIQFPICHLKASVGLDKALDITTDRINNHIVRAKVRVQVTQPSTASLRHSSACSH